MTMGNRQIFTTCDRHDLDEQVRAAFLPTWPQFLLHDPVDAEYLARVETYFPRYDVLILESGEVAAGGWGVPINWDGSSGGLPERGYDGALVSAVTGHEQDIPANTLCIMATVVERRRRGTGLARDVLNELRARASDAGLKHVVAPVRPALKSRYPLTAMAKFARWTRDDGLHIDPWIRLHQRLGAAIVKPAEPSMIITGTIAEWERWTGMAFPETGRYVVPDALGPVDMDRENDLGIYSEANLWMRHF